MQPKKILFLAAEADPLVKVGGLGDVAGSLPRALQQLCLNNPRDYAVDVRMVLPFHAAIRKKVPNPEKLLEFKISTRGAPVQAQVYHLLVNNVYTYLIAGEPIGEDAPVYDPDASIDGYKYIFFSLAALEMSKALGWKPDILHANDWHTAISVYASKLKGRVDPFFRDVHSIMTIHNLSFMGAGTAAAFDHFGLPPSRDPLMPWWALNFPLPLGIEAADRIVTVSPTYAREILTPGYACGLERLLAARQEVVAGIINGIDQDSWDPAKDTNIAANFDATSLAKRRQNKAVLTHEFSLDVDAKIPLLVLIARMDQQKGVDLAVEGLRKTVNESWQAILLGTGEPKFEEASRRLEKDYPNRVRAVIRFDEALSRRMYAGGDILLMPSRYEPCGLAQMMAMRYGCVPLAHATGGLQETIVDIADSEENGTGFLFKPASSAALAATLERALEVFPDEERWSAMQRRGMRQDFSWENSAGQYYELYREILHYVAS
jgi:starch synthase